MEAGASEKGSRAFIHWEELVVKSVPWKFLAPGLVKIWMWPPSKGGWRFSAEKRSGLTSMRAMADLGREWAIVLEAVYGDDSAGGWAAAGCGELLEFALEIVGVVGEGVELGSVEGRAVQAAEDRVPLLDLLRPQ